MRGTVGTVGRLTIDGDIGVAGRGTEQQPWRGPSKVQPAQDPGWKDRLAASCLGPGAEAVRTLEILNYDNLLTEIVVRLHIHHKQLLPPPPSLAATWRLLGRARDMKYSGEFYCCYCRQGLY